MAEQEPASSKMRWLYLHAMEYANFRVMAAQEPSFRAAWNQFEAKDRLKAQADALEARMKEEDQERTQMRALLERVQRVMFFDLSHDDPSMGMATWDIGTEEEMHEGRKQLLDEISSLLERMNTGKAAS